MEGQCIEGGGSRNRPPHEQRIACWQCWAGVGSQSSQHSYSYLYLYFHMSTHWLLLQPHSPSCHLLRGVWLSWTHSWPCCRRHGGLWDSRWSSSRRRQQQQQRQHARWVPDHVTWPMCDKEGGSEWGNSSVRVTNQTLTSRMVSPQQACPASAEDAELMHLDKMCTSLLRTARPVCCPDIYCLDMRCLTYTCPCVCASRLNYIENTNTH